MNLPKRLATPREHLATLIEPPAAEVLRVAGGWAFCQSGGQNARSTRDAAPLLDETLGSLRAALLEELELRGPIVLTGHQAEFFHAGVFAKTIAADALAAAVGGSAVFLTVDGDVPKTGALAVPSVATGTLSKRPVPIPGCDLRLPAEHQSELPAQRWCAFFEQVRDALARVADILPAGRSERPPNPPPDGETLLPTYAGGFLASPRPNIRFADAVVRGHAAVEHALGLGGSRDLRMSRLAQTRAFRALCAHLVLHAAGFAACYNEAQAAYRRRRRIRSPQRPVPPLAVGGGRVELPLWLVRAGTPRRRMAVARVTQRVVLLADDEAIGEMTEAELRPAAVHAEPWPIERAGWQVRPRALALSAFGRLLLGDVFIHGIGGATYDEMTEDFVSRFFGVAPAPMCCVSATLHLPLPRRGAAAQDWARARHALRDLAHNPERHLNSIPDELIARRRSLIDESRRLRETARHDRSARRRVYERLRGTVAALRAAAGEAYEAEAARLRAVERDYAHDRIALDREYFFALHDARDMARLVDRIRGDVLTAGGAPALQ